MQFGKVSDPENIDFNLPKDSPGTEKILLNSRTENGGIEVFVGCAKWNKNDLKNFYPKGTKDELKYYASRFNSIEFNASFYRIFPREQFKKWKDKTPDNFRFFPKVNQEISHIKRLLNTEQLVEEYIHSLSALEEKLGGVFLQMHANFAPKDFDRVVQFVEHWPKNIPLAMEFRHTNWYNDTGVANRLYDLLESASVANILTDTAGRRDLLHMRLTNSLAFIRFVGANHSSDYTRLNDWVERLTQWKKAGIQKICFFIHQNTEQESPLLADYFIKRMNQEGGFTIKPPLLSGRQEQLF